MDTNPFSGGAMPDMGALLAQAQQLQQQLADAQQELADARVEGSAGGSLVVATVSGQGELVGLRVDPRALEGEPADAAETVADLVLAAVRDAVGKAEQLQQRAMGPLAGGLGGLGGGLGGGDLGGLGGGLPGLPGGA